MRDSKRSNSRVIPIRPEGSGYAANGPGFYVWDEDLNEVLRMARELARGVLNVTPTTRFMRMRELPHPS